MNVYSHSEHAVYEKVKTAGKSNGREEGGLDGRAENLENGLTMHVYSSVNMRCGKREENSR